MDDSKISLGNFELLLQKQSLKKPSIIYNRVVNTNNQLYRPQDVIETVYSQIKAIHLADCTSVKTGGKSLYKPEKSNFLAVNKLPVYLSSMQEVPKMNPHRFETQCVSDTQLINIIDCAEAMDTHSGVTQEFDTTFAQVEDRNSCYLPLDREIDDENQTYRDKEASPQLFDEIKDEEPVVVKENTLDVVKSNQSKEEIIITKGNESETVRPIEEYKIAHVNLLQSSEKNNTKQIEDCSTPNINTQQSNTDTEDTVTFIQNLPNTQEANDELEQILNAEELEIDTGENTQRAPSPVLDIKSRKRKLKTPLVVSLASFEYFESIAIPLIEENIDYETTKHIINSQILGQELCLNSNTNNILDIDREYSPILDYKSDELLLQVNLDDLKTSPNKKISDSIVLLKDVEDVTEKRSASLKDEILFSSDEEYDYIHKEPKDLPLTCRLETSFCNQTEVLEKTLYVGFQTASYKSIEISRDSFQKAHTMLEDDKAVAEVCLTELVEKCDTKHENGPDSAPVILQENETVATNVESKVVSAQNKHASKVICVKDYMKNVNDDTKYPPDKRDFKGFMTANYKTIKMSKKALERCQNVFKDIDLNENFDAIGIPINEKKGSLKTIEANTMDENIYDELLLQEFENTEMSLEEKETVKEVNKDFFFEGFKTVNNKMNKISEGGETTNKVFKDINAKLDEHSNNIDNLIQSPVYDIGYKSANDKNIDISAQALSKTKNTSQGIELDNDVEIIDNINQPSTSKAVFVGFKTANNRDINISEEALSNTKNVFKDIGKEKPKIKPIDDIEKLQTGNVAFLGFKTASNKEIKISDEALSKSKNVFDGIEQEIHKIDTVESINQPSTSTGGFVGFKTANNKEIKINENGLAKTRKIFEDIDKVMPTKTKFEKPELTNKVRDEFTKSCSVGLKTGNNKEVNVSAKALLKSRNLFGDLNPTRLDDKVISCEDNKVQNPSNEIFQGFQTASKKAVTVSADGLARCKRIFQDIDEINELNEIPEKKSKNITNAEFKGYQTANKKPVKVNEEAVLASKEFEDFNGNLNKNLGNSFVGFKTASNKKVKISNDALDKCKKIFEGIEDMPFTAANPPGYDQNPDTVNGFQTASKKEVKLSKEAFKKTKSICQDIDNSFTEKEKGVCFGGFQTANKKKVKVSEHALAKSKTLFQDINTNINITPIKNNIDSRDNSKEIEEVTPNPNIFRFQTGNNTKLKVSEDSLKKSKKTFAESTNSDNERKCITLETKKENFKGLESANDIVNMDSLLDTQVQNNFEENLCSEDFKVITVSPNKRSGSPILSCPKPKRRKRFETPYKINPKLVTKFEKDIPVVKKAVNIIKFKEDYKKVKKYTLKDLDKLKGDKTKNIDPYILSFNLENILNFEFENERNDLKEGKITVEDIKQIFGDATEKKLIPASWMDIQLKLTIWKLISYEIRFPQTLGTVCTVKNVIDQLKYRYDKELYNAERPILRKILEKDTVPTKTMVLCIAGVYVDGVSVTSATKLTNIELLLTDGWYFIMATIDNMLSKLVYDRKIVVGCKIVTCGAELMNCEQGVSPWEDTSAIRLAMSGNSTRLAPWDAKLGLRPGVPLSRLASVKCGGGRVSRLRVRVTRVYPKLYVEKFQDGSTVTRSERLEHQYQMKYEAEREVAIEKIYEEVEKEFSDQESQNSEGYINDMNRRQCYESGSQICKLMKTSKDPVEFRDQLTSTQMHLLQEHDSKMRDKYIQAIQDKVQERIRQRNVVTLARGRVADVKREGDRVTVIKAMLSIWKPNDEVLDIFREGAWIEVTNVVPTAFRNSEIQLSAGRQSMFRPVQAKEDTISKPYLESLKRVCFSIKDVSQNLLVTGYNEIDTVGVIFSIEPTNREFESIKTHFQNLYLADIDKNIICVNFWGGIKKFGYENVLDTGQVVYCGNLQKRAGNTRNNIPQYRATEFSLFTKTPKNERAREMVDEMNKKMHGLDRRKFCEDCVAVKDNYSIIKCFNDTENISPYRFNRSEYNLGRNKMFIDTPLGVKVDKGKSEDFNLTGLDFESTFKQQDTQELSPKTLHRKQKVNERIAKLKMYGEPPPLNPVNIINKSKNTANSYKSPLLLKSDGVATPNKTDSVTSKSEVTTPTKLPECVKMTCDSDGKGPSQNSPIISMNRTYVKRSSVNPVKLNFSKRSAMNENGDTTDHFAEEFDGSPPLSLD